MLVDASSGLSATVQGNDIRDNGGDGIYVNQGAPVIKNNLVSGNGQHAIIVWDSSDLSLISGNTGSGNALQGLFLSGIVAHDHTWPASSFSYVLISHVGVTVPAGITLTVGAGAVVKSASSGESGSGPNYGQLLVQGHLAVPGTSESPVIFTTRADDSDSEEMSMGTAMPPSPAPGIGSASRSTDPPVSPTR